MATIITKDISYRINLGEINAVYSHDSGDTNLYLPEGPVNTDDLIALGKCLEEIKYLGACDAEPELSKKPS